MIDFEVKDVLVGFLFGFIVATFLMLAVFGVFR